VEKDKIKRGDVIIDPGTAILSSFLDVKVTILPDAPYSLKNGAEYLFMLGTSEIRGRVIILGRDQLKPQESGFVRFKLKEQVLARVGDHFVIRLPSPARTLGGGIVLDVFPSKLKRKDKELIPFLARRENLDLSELVLTELKKTDFLPVGRMLQASTFSQKEIETTVNSLSKEDKMVVIEDMVVDKGKWEKLLSQILEKVNKEHRDKPYIQGLRFSELVSKIKFKEKLISEGVEHLLSLKKLLRKENFLALTEHQPQLTGKQSLLEKEILKKFEENPFSPPTRGELLEENPEYQKILLFLLQQEKLIELKEGILYRKEDFEKIIHKIKELISQKGPATVSQIREHLNVSRKYAVPILERLDELGITKREGDKRVLGGRW
jgi:selenocysteine-specific elongation factor